MSDIGKSERITQNRVIALFRDEHERLRTGSPCQPAGMPHSIAELRACQQLHSIRWADMHVWRLMAHHDDPQAMVDWTKKNHRIAIGWSQVGDIEARGYASARDIGVAIRRDLPHLNNSGAGGANLWSFYAIMKPGDLVIVRGNPARPIVVQVEGDYEYVDVTDGCAGGYAHQRRVSPTSIDPDYLWRQHGGSVAPGVNLRRTLVRMLS